ncbi:hypothetical protein QVD99_003447 [Batrachochytrium dendrobatidis]|nr:hypothetical protein QVD99_003447 [Batrachochytrium dendrobatidis]
MLCLEPPYLHFPFSTASNTTTFTKSKLAHAREQKINIDLAHSEEQHHLEPSLVDRPPTSIKIIRVRNTGGQRTRIKFIPPAADSCFRLITNKKGYIYPGECETVQVEFRCISWAPVQDTFSVLSSEMDKLTVKLIAFPALQDIQIPHQFEFGMLSINQTKEKFINIPNKTNVDFNYLVEIVEELPSNCFSISPMEGVLKANSDTLVTIMFKPFKLCRAHCVFTIRTNQFAFIPLQCKAMGDAQLLSHSILPSIGMHIPIKTVYNRSKEIRENRIIAIKDSKHPFLPARLPKPLDCIAQPNSLIALNDQAVSLHYTFDEELHAREELQRRKHLSMFVCIGEDVDCETFANVEHNQKLQSVSTKHSSDTLSTPDIIRSYITSSQDTILSNMRIQTSDVKHSYDSLVISPSEQPNARLGWLFIKAGWKIIYQTRASKRIRLLKASQGNEPEWYSQSKKNPSYLDARLERVVASIPSKPTDFRYTPLKTYDTPIMDIIPFARSVVVPNVKSKYAERMGYKRDITLEETSVVQVTLPLIQFEKTVSKPVLKKEPASIKIMGITDPPFGSIFNPLPGIEPTHAQTSSIYDEASLHHIFHSQKIFNLESYERLTLVESRLKQVCLDMSIGFYDSDLV